MKFKIFRSPKTGEWYFRLVARNGRTVAQSEGYHDKTKVQKTIRSIKAHALTAPVLLVDPDTMPHPVSFNNVAT